MEKVGANLARCRATISNLPPIGSLGYADNASQKDFKTERRHPEWRISLQHIIISESTERLIMFTKFMWKYFKNNLKFFWSPLHFAVCNNLVEIVELLINTPTDFNIKEKSGYAPLHWIRSIEMLKLFFKCKEEKKINLNEVTRCGKTLLYLAMQDLKFNSPNQDLVRFILEKRHEYGIKIDGIVYKFIQNETNAEDDFFNRILKCLHDENITTEITARYKDRENYEWIEFIIKV